MPTLSVFVACPYRMFPLDDYKRVFSNISKKHPVVFKFADEQVTNQHVLEKVLTYIREHDFSLFDITGWNPNVSLELGIAVGSGKKYFILLNTHLDANKDAPSDIKGIDRIQYSSNEELEAKITILINQELPKENSESIFITIRDSIFDVLQNHPGISLPAISTHNQHDKSIVQTVLRALVQSGDVKTTGQRRGTKYYPKQIDLRTISKSSRR